MGNSGGGKGMERRTGKHWMRGVTEEGEFAAVPGWEGGAEEEWPLLDVSCFSGGLLVVWVGFGGGGVRYLRTARTEGWKPL